MQQNLIHPPYWQQACDDLAQSDPVLKKVIRSYHGEILTARGDPFYILIRSIVGQQLSIKAADTVFSRLQALVLDEMRPDVMMKLQHDQLRGVGLSQAKARYVLALSEWWHHHNMIEVDWDEWDDHHVIQRLTEVKGIGRWTAEMFLIFALHRPNVLPTGDLGLQKAIGRRYTNQYSLHDFKSLSFEYDQQNRFEQGLVPQNDDIQCYSDWFEYLRQLWTPWCSVATWYLWRSLNMDV